MHTQWYLPNNQLESLAIEVFTVNTPFKGFALQQEEEVSDLGIPIPMEEEGYANGNGYQQRSYRGRGGYSKGGTSTWRRPAVKTYLKSLGMADQAKFETHLRSAPWETHMGFVPNGLPMVTASLYHNTWSKLTHEVKLFNNDVKYDYRQKWVIPAAPGDDPYAPKEYDNASTHMAGFATSPGGMNFMMVMDIGYKEPSKMDDLIRRHRLWSEHNYIGYYIQLSRLRVVLWEFGRRSFETPLVLWEKRTVPASPIRKTSLKRVEPATPPPKEEDEEDTSNHDMDFSEVDVPQGDMDEEF